MNSNEDMDLEKKKKDILIDVTNKNVLQIFGDKKNFTGGRFLDQFYVKNALFPYPKKI